MPSKEYSYSHNNQNISYRIWFSDDSDIIEHVVFLGTVQVGMLAQWVAESCPPRTAVVQGAPHWFASKDGSDISDFMFGYTAHAFEALIANYTLADCNIVADSQAVPGVVKMLTQPKYEQFTKNIALLQPLGFNANIFLGNNDQRMAIFVSRIIKNGYYQLKSLLLDKRLRYNHRLLGKTVSFRDPVARAQYGSGLKYNALPDLKKLTQSHKKIIIICGEKDMIFRSYEIENNLAQNNIPIKVIVVKNVPHSPLPTRKGVMLLNESFKYFV